MSKVTRVVLTFESPKDKTVVDLRRFVSYLFQVYPLFRKEK
jgi:hypothetical protein